MEELFYYLCGNFSNLAWFVKTFVMEDFDGIDKLFYIYLRFCNKLQVNPKECLDSYFITDAFRDIKANNIKLETQVSLDYSEPSQLREAVKIISEIAKTSLGKYTAAPEEVRDFKLVANEVINKMKQKKLEQFMLDSFAEISEGEDVTDSSIRLTQRIHDINTRLDGNSLSNIEFKSASQDDDKMIFVAKTGMPCIDGDIGGIYAPLIYTLNSQPGGGKTKMSIAHFSYPVLLAGRDVLYYELELSRGQTENIAIAHHIAKLYKGRMKIPDTLLNKYDELTEEERHVYEAAKDDLLDNPKYGQFSVQTELCIETMEEDLTNKIKQSDNLGLLVIDYVGLIRSMPRNKYERRLEKAAIISMAYEIVRALTKRFKIPALMINQFNDAGIEAAESGRRIRPGMVQGGHEPGRYTDYDLNLTYTLEQKIAQARTLSSATKTRGSQGFPDQLLSTDLAISMFRQVSNIQKGSTA